MKPDPKKLAIKQQKSYAARACAKYCQEEDVTEIPDEVLRNLKKHIGSPVPIESVEHGVKIINTFMNRYEKLHSE